MKKVGVLLIVSLMILMIGVVSAVELCYDGTSPTKCVCGHTPNSSQGYGQIIIGGFTPSIISCNNMADGVCPEDFVDPSTGLVASCSVCTDADCAVAGPSTPSTGYVWGYVKDGNGRPVEKAVVSSHPGRWNESARLEYNVTTRSNGFFNTTEFISGTYYISASKDTYDTELKEITIVRGIANHIDFTLNNGTCHEDCTNSYNRCNAACDGLTFGNATSGAKCKFYNSTVKDLCNNRLKGTEVFLGSNGTNAGIFVRCCGEDLIGDPTGSEGLPYQKYYAKADTGNGNIKNLVKVEKIAKYNDVPVRIVIAYWQQN